MTPPDEPGFPADPAIPAQPLPSSGSTAAATPAAAAAAQPVLDVSALQSLGRELLRERRTERRWRVFFRLVWLALGLALIWATFSQRMHKTSSSAPHTAMVEVRGEIALDSEASAEQLLAGLRNAFEDVGAQAVVLRINSPGGSPVQAGIVNDEIRRLKVLHKKKVYAVVEEMCASGAYYIAVAADEIYVDKASIVGSIGVLMDGFGFSGVMEKYGVERRLITAGRNKAMLDPFSPEKPEHRAYAQSMLNQIHQQFIGVVRDGRGDRLKEGADTFSGLYWNGEDAVKLGLADHLGNLDYVAREVIKAEEIIDYTPRENVAEKLAKRIGASIGESAMRAAGGVLRLR